ncbi:uncharacterized protein PRCAT00004413001 [Priceomyces carsonii]|uniref:uncharacterized protein n=1 Tax=Priceomyces carsonii TaxID=28549 RepID=UPI002ED7EC55|nr:unnamed protein product [Priceomyces carsonii]
MGSKRKRPSSAGLSQKANKKKGTSLLTIKEIQEYGDQIISSKKYNSFVPLIKQLQDVIESLGTTANEEYEMCGRKIALVLFQCFQKVAKDHMLVSKKSYDENKSLIVKWLIEKYQSFKDILLRLLKYKLTYLTSLQIDALELYLNLIKVESHFLKPSVHEFYFPTSTYQSLVLALLQSQNGDIVADGSSDNFCIIEFIEIFKDYWDLQFYLNKSLEQVLSEWNSNKNKEELRLIFANYYSIIKVPLLFKESSDELKVQKTWIESELPSIAYKSSSFKSNYQNSLLTLLSFPLTSLQYKGILLILHKRIIPYLTKPERLMDFLTDSYDAQDDAIVPILALNSLYELMKRYNLEYPDFYTKLYSLLTPDLLSTRYRSRFFRLCDLFLSSTHLSSKLIASFIKRLSRLSLTASAPSIVIIIPFVYNLLRRHPSCMVLIHNIASSKATSYTDPYDNQETNPLQTKAMDSSLWELETIMSHYHPNIATLAKIFGEPFRKNSYNMEDFLDWSYVTLLESEKTRNYKGLVALEFESFDKLFVDEDESVATSSYVTNWSL